MLVGIIVGLVVVIVVGVGGFYLMHRSHQRTVRKLIRSRSKLERQRTQAVNDLFSFRSDVESGLNSGQIPAVQTVPDPRMAEEVANLQNLLVRAEAALATAKRKRAEYESEIATLRTQLANQQDGAKVISLHADRPAVG